MKKIKILSILTIFIILINMVATTVFSISEEINNNDKGAGQVRSFVTEEKDDNIELWIITLIIQ